MTACPALDDTKGHPVTALAPLYTLVANAVKWGPLVKMKTFIISLDIFPHTYHTTWRKKRLKKVLGSFIDYYLTFIFGVVF